MSRCANEKRLVSVERGYELPRENSTLIARINVAQDLAILRIRPDGPLFRFRPGQYTVIGLPDSTPRFQSADLDEDYQYNGKLIRRAYSIASSSKVAEYVELYITLVRSGALTPRLWLLRPGDRLWLGPKALGHFTLDKVPPDKNLVLIGTGTGLAPYMSMIRDHHRCNQGRKFVVVHGARYASELGYRDELESLDRNCRTLVYLPTVSRPGNNGEWHGHVGRVQTLFIDGLLDYVLGQSLAPDSTHVFVAGNPEMVEDMQRMLERRGYVQGSARQPGTLHIERYW